MARRTNGETEQNPDDLAREAFSRCSNWPQDRHGQIGLAQGLKLAATRFGFTMAELIAVAREESAFCPTDYDLLKLAKDMRQRIKDSAAVEASVRQQDDWRKQYGAPAAVPVDWSAAGAGKENEARDHAVREHLTAARGSAWPGWKKISWREIYYAWRELGYDLTVEQERVAGMR